MLQTNESYGAQSASSGTSWFTPLKGVPPQWLLATAAAFGAGNAAAAPDVDNAAAPLRPIITESTYTARITLTTPPYRPKTALAQRLMSIRQEAIKSGVKLLPASTIIEDMRKLRDSE